MKHLRFVCCLLLFTIAAHSQSRQPVNAFLVCGDDHVLLVDYSKSTDNIPHIIWSWDAHTAEDIPPDFRLKKFNSIDDCKAIQAGQQILVSSSAGAVAIVQKKR